MGSVKDLEVIEQPTETKLGIGIFVFSDRYSVFDWGEMPDHIPNKGAALCMMAAYNFEQLNSLGVRTHYLGVVGNSEILIGTTQLSEPSNRMAVNLSRVIRPNFVNGGYDYTLFFSNRGNNFVLPLEVIYRRGAPQGSSLFKKIKELEQANDTERLRKLLRVYGLSEKPKPGDLFPQVGFDFTTKFERKDRRLSDEEAYKLSGLTREQWEFMVEVRQKAVDLVGRITREADLVDFDGKHEYIFSSGNILLGDVFGTFDENRFMLNGRQVSKEFLRQYHKQYQPKWVADVERAKEEAEKKGIQDWKSLVKVQPRKLDPRLVNLVGEMYASGSDRYTGLNLFPNTRPLEEVMDDLAEYWSELK